MQEIVTFIGCIVGCYLDGVVIIGEEERCAKTYAHRPFTITSKSILSIRFKLTL